MSVVTRNDAAGAPGPAAGPARRSKLRTLAFVLAGAGVLLLAFGFWGTHSGVARYGRGFVPIAASSAGGMLLIAGVLVDIADERRRRKAAKRAPEPA